MHASSRFFIHSTICFSLFLNGCASSLIEKKLGSESVVVVPADKVAGCTSKGKVSVSVLANIWLIKRGTESVEENLVQLASNTAVDLGADTMVKGESKEFGERTFDLYKCR